jgi:hypothetical protein
LPLPKPWWRLRNKKIAVEAMDWFSEIGGDAWELRGTYKAVKISKTD